MKAEIGIFPKDRQLLHSIVPLDTPLLVDFHISNLCNFKCNYCMNSSPKEVYASSGLRRELMSWETFELALEQLKEFPQKIKQISLDGIGEPTLNKRLPDMVEALRKAEVAQTVMVITNGSQLSPELSQQLVDAGLQVLRISLQGLSAKKYMEISQAKIDWDRFYQNIKYFSQIRGDCKLKVKIADTALEEGDEEKFYTLFGDICDAVAVEHIYDAFSNIGKVYTIALRETEKNRFGLDIRNIDTCWFPFTRIDLRSDGTFANCCNSLFGFEKNIREDTILEQWNGAAMCRMRADFLRHNTKEYAACQKCHIPIEVYHPEDLLDGHEAEILDRMRERGMLYEREAEHI